jgi:hypothetical protein
VIIGVSLTATRENADEILSDEVTGPVWREWYKEGKGTPPAPMKRR